MLSVYRTLSTRYLRERWTRALLIVASIALGVATLVATFSLNDTMNKAVRTTANPLAGDADLTVSNGDRPIDRALADRLAEVRGVRSVRPLLFANVRLLDLKEDRSVLLAGVDLAVIKAMKDNPWGIKPEIWHSYAALVALATDKFCVVGEELNSELDKALPDRGVPLRIRAAGQKKGPVVRLTRVGTVTAEGPAAALGGNLLVTTIDNAAEILGQPRGLVTRIDLTLEPGYEPEQVRRRVETLLARRSSAALVKTPEEQYRSSQKAMAGMQAGFALCGLGALVVGMFLVYNALSVSVAERRHEIGILRSLGATRAQVRTLFAGEALLLGLAGAVVGVPLGLGLAYLALEPMKEVISQIFRALEANRVEWTVDTVLIAAGAGMVTALLASLVPAFRASWEEPAVAVRRVPETPTWRYRFVQVAGSALLLTFGLALILLRHELPRRVGTYGGLLLFLLGALLATPLFAAAAARLIQPVARRLLGIEGRLAADNLVRAPARTGLVIAAVAAGVSLVMQTAGTLRSNRDAVRDWVERYIAADLVITAGSPVSVGGQGQLMDPDLGPRLERVSPKAIRAVLPVRFRHPTYRDTEVLLIAVPARRFVQIDLDHTRRVPDLDLYDQMAAEPGTALVSENFAALYGVAPGDTIELSGVRLRVLGRVRDYSWNLGTVIMDWDDYRRQFKHPDPKVDVFDVYLRPGADPRAVQTRIGRAFGADKGLVVLTHDQLQRHIANAIDRLYGIAYGQQIVVGVVAALGVVTALLIAVLQRRRELGVLRAVGASRGQVVRSVLAEAALMGVIGTAIGLVVGIPLEWYVLQVAILEESGYLFPVTVPWAEAGVIAAIALLLATLAGLIPALHAVRQRIPEAIAHE
jgi:putative ABC transport system permease protein